MTLISAPDLRVRRTHSRCERRVSSAARGDHGIEDRNLVVSPRSDPASAPRAPRAPRALRWRTRHVGGVGDICDKSLAQLIRSKHESVPSVWRRPRSQSLSSSAMPTSSSSITASTSGANGAPRTEAARRIRGKALAAAAALTDPAAPRQDRFVPRREGRGDEAQVPRVVSYRSGMRTVRARLAPTAQQDSYVGSSWPKAIGRRLGHGAAPESGGTPRQRRSGTRWPTVARSANAYRR